MTDSSATLHENPSDLRPETIERHRAYVSLIEELEAADWYDQRVDAASDDELKEILAHNRDEEKEHAAMVLEWLRRRDPTLDAQLREFLFKDGEIVAHEHGDCEHEIAHRRYDESLGIGSLREEVGR